MNDEPSSQTIRAIGHCREEFADTRGTTRNAVDKMMIGLTHDPYSPFREHFKDVCGTPEADPDAYLNDLQSLKQQFRPSQAKNVCEAFLDNLEKAHAVIESYSRAHADGTLDKEECLDLIPKLSRTREAVDALMKSVIDRKNEIAGVLPEDVKEKAAARSNGARAR